MKKNAVIIITVIAISVATVKTGYAFYEKQITDNQTNENQLTNDGGEFWQETDRIDFYETKNTPELESEVTETDNTGQISAADPALIESGQADDSYAEEGCCGGDSVNMIDDNGNLKDRETFAKELDEAVQNGDITEEDKEYYLYMYDQCAVIFGADSAGNNSGTEGNGTQGGAANGNYGYFPSCH